VEQAINRTHGRHPVLCVLGIGLLGLPVFLLTLPVAILALPAVLGLGLASMGAPTASRR
jgi:hypothetical protein